MKTRLFVAHFIISAGLAVLAGSPISGTITTVAGNGTPGSGGDGGPATAAQLSAIAGIAVDMAGNLYIADNVTNTIRKVSPEGVINTVLGTSEGLRSPMGIAADAAGNLYIYDLDRRVLKMTPAGVVSTIGDEIFASDGYPVGIATDSAGNVYFAYTALFHEDWPIYKVSLGGKISAVCHAPGEPLRLAVDSAENLYFSTRRWVTDNIDIYEIWKVDPQGRMTEIFPTSEESSYPLSVAVDSTGNLFIAEAGEKPQVWMVTPDGTATIVAGNGRGGFGGDGGPATSAQLSGLISLAVDSAGNLLIGDSGNYRIRKVTWAPAPATDSPHVMVGGGGCTTFALSNTGDSTTLGDLILTDQQGRPLTALGIGVGAGSSFPISIGPAGTLRMHRKTQDLRLSDTYSWLDARAPSCEQLAYGLSRLPVTPVLIRCME
jgi:hypothetical protein